MGRARDEVARIKAQEAAEEERRQKRMRELRVEAEVFGSWTANGGTAEEFEAAWPQMRAEMLKQRTIEQDSRAPEDMRQHTRSTF